MDTNIDFKQEIYTQINDMFVSFIYDMRGDISDQNIKKCTFLTISGNNAVIEYGLFMKSICEIIIPYIPQKNESPLLKAVRMLPHTIKNVKRININNEIAHLRRFIYSKYFSETTENHEANEMFIKKKIDQLKFGITDCLENQRYSAEQKRSRIERLLSSFDERYLRENLLTDWKALLELHRKRSELL